MHVLRQTNEALVPGGVLVDLHPVGVGAHLEADGRELGYLDEADFRELVVATEAGLEEAIRLGLFVREVVLRRELVERWNDPEELLEDVAEWETQRVPPDVERRVRESKGPIDLIERFVFQRLRTRTDPAGGQRVDRSFQTDARAKPARPDCRRRKRRL